MNIDIVRDKVNNYKGKVLNFRFNGSRNQIEEFSAKIISTYPSIFLVELVDNRSIKSFSYNDILIKKLIMKVSL